MELCQVAGVKQGCSMYPKLTLD